MYKVLLIDDEINVLNVIKSTFKWKEYGFEIIASLTDPKKALELIKKEKPEVLFTDIEMPELNGLELIKMVRDGMPDLKIVIISAYDKFEYAQQAISYNVFAYCLKPFKREMSDEILLKLKTALDKENKVYESVDLTNNIYNINFKKLVKYVEENYTEKLFLNELADKFELNVTYCCLLFNKHFNCTFTEYLTNQKMEEAAKLLKETNKSVYEIADWINYDYFYFAKVFKKHYGITPRQYRGGNAK